MRYIMAMLGGVCVLSSDDLAFDWLVWRERRGGAAGLGPAAGSVFANCHTQPQREVGRVGAKGARARWVRRRQVRQRMTLSLNGKAVLNPRISSRAVKKRLKKTKRNRRGPDVHVAYCMSRIL